jgi:hypothetical protein
MELIPSGWRAAMSGATTLAAGLSWAGIAWGGGYVIAALGYRSLFLAGAGMTAVGALVFWVCFRLARSGRTPRAWLTRIGTWSASDP